MPLEPEPLGVPSVEPTTTMEPPSLPEPEPTVAPGPVPALMIVVERGSSMFAESAPDAGIGCATGSSPPYGAHPDRWEAVREIVAGLAEFEEVIDFTALTYRGESGGDCPVLTSADALFGFEEIVAALPPSESACPSQKAEGPTGAAIDAAAELLLLTAPEAPKYLLLFTRGRPDTCAVPDPQCGADRAIAAVQSAHDRGIQTLVVSLHAADDFPVSEYLAHAGRGNAVPPYPEDAEEEFCVLEEYNRVSGTAVNDPNWRAYASASYGASGSSFPVTLSYTGEQVEALYTTLGEIASGTF